MPPIFPGGRNPWQTPPIFNRDGIHRLAASAGHHGVTARQRGGTTFEHGAIQIQVNTPAPEKASVSINERLRVLSAFGLFEGAG